MGQFHPRHRENGANLCVATKGEAGNRYQLIVDYFRSITPPRSSRVPFKTVFSQFTHRQWQTNHSYKTNQSLLDRLGDCLCVDRGFSFSTAAAAAADSKVNIPQIDFLPHKCGHVCVCFRCVVFIKRKVTQMENRHFPRIVLHLEFV